MYKWHKSITKGRNKKEKDVIQPSIVKSTPPKKRKHPFSKRAESMADMMVQFYREKIALADEPDEKKEVTSIEIDGDDQLCEGCYVCLVFYVCFVAPSL